MSQTLDRLVYMANQIATAFKHQEPDKAVAATYDHIWHFWDPRMRERIVDHHLREGVGLSDVAFAAIEMLSVRAAPSSVTRSTGSLAAKQGEAASDAG